MSSLSSDYLKCNLQEFYAAAHLPQASLVANPQGTRIYVAEKGVGRLWTFFYDFIGIFNSEAAMNIKGVKLKKAVRITHETFHEKLYSVETHLKVYAEYLDRSCNGYVDVGDSTQIIKSRYKITKWNDISLPILKLLHEQKNASLLQMLENYSNPHQPTAPIFSPEFLTQCSQEQSIIDLESILQTSTPFNALGKFWRGQHLDEIEMRRCIRIIRQRQDEIPSSLFHDAVKSMIELDHVHNPMEVQATLARLEVMLIDEGCSNLFIKDDKQHLAWRDALREGDSATCNGNTLVLGPRVGMPRLHDKTVLFEVQGDPDTLVTFKINRALHGIKRELQNRLSRSSNGTYRIVPYKDIDASGSCALIPRLQMTLDNIPWTTRASDEKIHTKDHAQFNSICELIKNMLKNQLTPLAFTSNNLMFDQQKNLWFFKAPQEGPFDFNAIQDFVLTVANNDLVVFKRLMHTSGMDAHPIAQLYQQVVEEALKDTYHENIVNIIQRADIDEAFSSKPKILKEPIQIRAQQLYNEVLAIKHACVANLQRSHKMTPAEASKTASKELFKAYMSTHAAGIVWPNMIALVRLDK